jgi:hypothetical protein
MALSPRILRQTKAVPPPTTPAALLLNFNGTNGSTTFTDSSPNAFTVTPSGNAEISTAQSKFGGASGFFDGSGDYLTIGNDAALNFDGEFTIEAWVRPASLSGAKVIVSKWNNGGSNDWLVFIQGGTLFFNYLSTTSASGPVSPQVGTWHHVAVVRSGSQITLYFDGTSVGTGSSSANISGTSNVLVGANDGGANYWDGYIDDLRILKDRALYTANFTPPAAQLGPNA